MKSLKIDDGYKEFMINDDQNRVIRINPTDMAILTRFDEAVKKIEASQKEKQGDFALNPDGSPVSQLEQAGEAVRKLTEMIEEQVNYIFNSEVAKAVFGKQSPLSMVGGVPLYERFFEAIIPEIEETLKEEQKKSAKRIGKYVEMVKC